MHQPNPRTEEETAPPPPGRAPGLAGGGAKPGEGRITPMMAQYLAVKGENPDGLLFYRMGDFYELFFDDAVEASRALDIALTKRGRHLGRDIPMCGVPVKSHEGYLSKLIRKGFKVCVCEQMEDPAAARKRGAKSVVRRDVVRMITSGTLTEDSLLEARANNYLAALAEAGGKPGVAWIDVSTGDLQTQPLDAGDFSAVLARLDAGEILVSDALAERWGLFSSDPEWAGRLSPLPPSRFDSENARKRLESLFGVKALDAFGSFSRAELAAAGALIDYVELTQKGRLPNISIPRRLGPGAVLEIDAATRRNLELTQTLAGERKGSLLSIIDYTVTGAGGRALAQRLAAPLTDVAVIERRLDAVAFFMDHARVREGLRDLFKPMPDMERALSRLTLGRGGPRDLAALGDGLALSAQIRDALGGGDLAGLPNDIETNREGLGHHGETVDVLRRALGQDLPLYARDGGFIAKGYSPELDGLVTLRDESRRLIANLQSRYASETGVQALKVRHNNVLGYFIEVPAKQADKIPASPGDPFIHRQTMANAVRFTTVELGDLEGKIAKAADRALALELKLFEDLVSSVTSRCREISQTARVLADLDVGCALAELAQARRYNRPSLENSTAFEIKAGRHPVVEAALEAANEGGFVANGCRLDGAGKLWLLTGPNMAGKSTFLRQNALIAVLAQMGSFVPAESARIGVVDRLFSRVGASDDLARGRSTFMVEMVETAAILNQASSRSLVILDEIGRGTATFDGLSIAWAVVEHLSEINGCRALFATHYHELTALSAKLDGVACHTMKVKEWRDTVVFLHEVAAGAADRSYGIHVGQLAGLPRAVITRAEQILEILEKGEQSSALSRLAEDLPLFSAAPPGPVAAQGPSPIEEALAALHPDEMTPRQAIEALYRLKALLPEPGRP